jgi:hypothetical protein
MLRIFLFGLSNRRKQPERYTPFALKFSEILEIKEYGNKYIVKIV